MKKKFLYAALLVSLLAAGCNKKAGAPQPAPEASPPVQEQAQKPAGQAQTVQNAGKPDYHPNAAQPGAVQSQPAGLTVYQTVEGSNFNSPSYQVAENTTALAFLKTSHKVVTKDYGSLGEMVTSIDGIAPRLDQFWAFYVNGKLANVGAGSYTLKNDDKLEWKLNSVNSYQPNSQ